MGRDKALLPWDATDLLGHTLARLAVVTDAVRLLSGPEPRYGDRGVPEDTDVVAGAGPLAGLLTALERDEGRGVLLLGADLPLVPTSLLARLAARLESADAVVPVAGRGPEPLCAAYGPACLGPVRRYVAAGDLGMTAFWREVRVRPLCADELLAFGDPEILFLNVNTPEDYERALRLR
jgi:molybdopterin-guanine dinucleotide biosynthesis protein A